MCTKRRFCIRCNCKIGNIVYRISEHLPTTRGVALLLSESGIASTVRVETNERKSSLGNCETLDQDGVLRVF